MTSTGILCVTPNPALDRTLEVAGLPIGESSRAAAVRVAAGGKGLNVARSLATLGAQPVCMGPLGGASGRRLAELAEAEGLRSAWTWLDVETRTCVILVDTAAQRATVVNEPGPRLSDADWSRLTSDVLARASVANVAAACVSGSLPPGVPPEQLAALARALVASGRPTWVDSSGRPLGAALAARGVGIKINRDEASEALGVPLEDASACAAAARRLLERGPSAVVMTLGAEGAVLAAPDGCWHAAAPVVETASAVASGDAFLAGLVDAWTSGAGPREALRRAVAAGTANALAGGGARFSRPQFDSVLARVPETREA
jgi:1-phosphofructokinase family hexose kinase